MPLDLTGGRGSYYLGNRDGNIGLPNITGGSGPQLSFDEDQPPSYEETLARADAADAERRRQRYDEVMGDGYGDYSGGAVSRDAGGTYRGVGDPSVSTQVLPSLYAGGYGGGGEDPRRLQSINGMTISLSDQYGVGSSQPAAATTGGVRTVGGGSTVNAQPGRSYLNPVTTRTDQVLARNPIAEYQPPAAYQPTKMDDSIYRQLKFMLEHPGAIQDDAQFRMLLDQGLKAAGRSAAARGGRMSGNAMLDFQKVGQGTAANYYNQRLQQLLGGSGEERTRWGDQEGARFRGWQGRQNTWQTQLGAAQNQWNARLGEARRMDEAQGETDWAREGIRNTAANPWYRSGDPQGEASRLRSWGMNVPQALHDQTIQWRTTNDGDQWGYDPQLGYSRSRTGRV